jgi:hypothetical protein
MVLKGTAIKQIENGPRKPLMAQINTHILYQILAFLSYRKLFAINPA